MDTLFNPDSSFLPRRNFLKLSGQALAALFWLPLAQQAPRMAKGFSPAEGLPGLGRVLGSSLAVHSDPNLSSKVNKYILRDQIIPIIGLAVSDDQKALTRVWYQVEQGYVYSGWIQPVENQLNPIIEDIPKTGRLAQVTVPIAKAVRYPVIPDYVAYRLYFGTTYWVTGFSRTASGRPWYHLFDDKSENTLYVNPEHLHLMDSVELQPLSTLVPPTLKRIEVRLQEQIVVAYEEDRVVLISRTATGARYGGKDFGTPTGRFMTNRKRPSRHMASNDNGDLNGFDLIGVPFVSYLTRSGVSFHGTFWHNDFGRPRSHGCINLPDSAARWIYRWTDPVVPFDQPHFEAREGTTVEVI